MTFSLLTLSPGFKENPGRWNFFGSGSPPLGYRPWSALLELPVHKGPRGLGVPMWGTGCIDSMSAMPRVQPTHCQLKAEWKQSKGKGKGQNRHEGVGICVQDHILNHLLEPGGAQLSALSSSFGWHWRALWCHLRILQDSECCHHLCYPVEDLSLQQTLMSYLAIANWFE